MAKRFVVAIWMALVLVLAGLLFAVHLTVLGAVLIVFEFAMGFAIAVWRPDRSGEAAGEAGAGSAAAGRPRLGTPLDPVVRVTRRQRRREAGRN